MGTRKAWEDLTIADDYMFKLVMSHERICKPLLKMRLRLFFAFVSKINPQEKREKCCKHRERTHSRHHIHDGLPFLLTPENIDALPHQHIPKMTKRTFFLIIGSGKPPPMTLSAFSKPIEEADPSYLSPFPSFKFSNT